MSSKALANIVTSIYALCNKLVETHDDLGTRSSVPELALVHRHLPDLKNEENDQRKKTAADAKRLADFAALVAHVSPSERRGGVGYISVPKGGWSSIIAKAIALNNPSFGYMLQLTKAELNDDEMNELVTALAKNTSISSLLLGNNSISDDNATVFIESLASNTTMTRLDLKNTQISGEKVKQLLLSNRCIDSVDLSNNKLGDIGARLMADVLESNPAITDLYLDNNGIGDVGAGSLATAIETSETKTIRILYLVDNHIEDKMREKIREAMRDRTNDYEGVFFDQDIHGRPIKYKLPPSATDVETPR